MMGGTDNRAPNVIVTVLVSYLVGMPAACCIGALLFGAIGNDIGGYLMLALVAVTLVGPGAFAWWWNYRRGR